MARLAERKAAAESEYDATAAKLWDEYQLTVSQAEELCVEFDSLPALRAQVADLRNQIRALGNVNVSAIEEYQAGAAALADSEIAPLAESYVYCLVPLLPSVPVMV